jgi:hypothetical protein
MHGHASFAIVTPVYSICILAYNKKVYNHHCKPVYVMDLADLITGKL